MKVALRRPGETFANGFEDVVGFLVHPRADIAVVDIASTAETHIFKAAPSHPSNGDRVRVLDAPSQGLDFAPLGPMVTLRGSVVSSVKSASTGKFKESWFECALPAVPGSSGGPVLNEQDEVVGIYSRSGPNGSTICVTLDGLKELL
jgi:S1-C subfamily serine protease